MTKRTRYFILAAGAALVFGVGGGLIAYLAYNRIAGVPAGVPSEVRYVPANAEIVAFANVRAIMASDVRRALMPGIDPESRKGRQMMNEFAGVDLEKQVDHVVMYAEPFVRGSADRQPAPPKPNGEGAPRPNGDGGRSGIPRASMLVGGSFDQARIEQFIRERGGSIVEHNGRKLFVHDTGRQEIAVGFIEANVIAIGQADLVRRAIDISRGSARDFRDITTNREMMNLVRDNSGSTAWVAGQFEEISRRMKLPAAISSQVPPVRLVSAKADIDGGLRATIRAEAGDKAAADQLRDVVRGFISLARLQAGDKEELGNVLKTVELSGTENTVRLSFAVSPETLRLITPQPRRRREPANPATPANPTNPAPEAPNRQP